MAEVVGWNPAAGTTVLIVEEQAGRPTASGPIGTEFTWKGQRFVTTQYGALPGTDVRANQAFSAAAARHIERAAAPRTAAQEAAITGVTRVTGLTPRQLEEKAKAEGRWDPVTAKITEGEGYVAPRVSKPLPVLEPTARRPSVAVVRAGVDVYGARGTTRALTQRETAERYAGQVSAFGAPMMGVALSKKYGTGELAGERVRQVPMVLGMEPTEAKPKVVTKPPAPPAPKKKYLPTGREELEWVPPSEKTVTREKIKREAIERKTTTFEADVSAFEERKTAYESGPRADYDKKLADYQADLQPYYNPATGKYEVPESEYAGFVKREASLSAGYTTLNKTVTSLDLEAQVLRNRAQRIGQQVGEHKALVERINPPLQATGGVSKRPTYPVTWEGKTTEFKTREQAEAAIEMVEKIQEKKAQALYETLSPVSARVFARPTGKEGFGESILRGGVGLADLPVQLAAGAEGVARAGKRAIERGFGKPGREYLTEAEREVYDAPVGTLGITAGFVLAGPALGVAGKAVAPYVPKLVQAPLTKIGAKVAGLPAPVKTTATLTGFGLVSQAPAAYKGEMTTEQWIGSSIGMGLAAGGLHAGIKAQPVRVAALKVPIKGEKVKTVYGELYLRGEKPRTVLGVTETGKFVTKLPETIKDMPSLKKLDLPEQMAINIESYPKTVLETRFLTQPKVMKELGFKPREAVKVEAGLTIMRGLHEVKTEFVRELPKKTKALTEPGTATITSILKKRSGEIERVRGTFSADPQMPAKYSKVPSDIDVALKGDINIARDFAKESVEALKAKGITARVDETGGHVRVMVEKGGVSRKAVEFSYVGEPPELAVGLGAPSAKEMRYGLEAVKPPVGYKGVPMTQLREQVVRWPSTSLTWWKGGKIEPPLQRPAEVAKAWGAGKTLLERGRALKVVKEPQKIEAALKTWREAKWKTPGVKEAFKAMEERGAPKEFKLEYPKSLIEAGKAPSLLRLPSAARPSVSSLGAVSFKSFASASSRASQSAKSSVSSSVSSVASLPSKVSKPPVSVPSRVSARQTLALSAFGYPSLKPSKPYTPYRPYAPSRAGVSFLPSRPSLVSGVPSTVGPSLVSGPSAPFAPSPPPPPTGFVPIPFDWAFGEPGKGVKKPELFGRRTRYAPSLLAQVLKIRGKQPKGLLTGLEIRPLPKFKPVKFKLPTPRKRGRKRK